jgi:hypothetical protein
MDEHRAWKIEEQVGQELGGADAAALHEQVPELDDWKAKAAVLEGGGGFSLPAKPAAVVALSRSCSRSWSAF